MPNRSLNEFRAELADFAAKINSALELVDEARSTGATNLADLREWLREHPVNADGDATMKLTELHAHVREANVHARRIAATISFNMEGDDAV